MPTTTILDKPIRSKFIVSIGNDVLADAVTLGCKTAEAAARAAWPHAKFGEIITVIGPRGGRTQWEAVGNGQVWKK